jgi:hypothetical protein
MRPHSSGRPSDDKNVATQQWQTMDAKKRGYTVSGKLCFVSNFFIYSFNFHSPFAVFSSCLANSHFPLYYSIHSYDYRQTNEKQIHWTAQNYRTIQAFTWLKGGPHLQCPLATAPTWAFYSNPVRISCNLSSVSSTSSRVSQTPGRFKLSNSSREFGYIVPRMLSPSSAVNSRNRSNVHQYSVRPLSRRRPPLMACVGRPYPCRIRTNGSGR